MNRFSTLAIGWCVLAIAGWSPTALRARMPQDSSVNEASPANPGESTPSLPEVQAAIDALEADVNLEETIKAALKEEYEQAIEDLQAAASFASKTEEYANAIESGPARIEQLQAELQALESSDASEQEQSLETTAEVQRQLDSRQVSVELLRKQLSELDQQSTVLEKRPVEIPARLLKLQGELSEIRERLASPELAAQELSPSLLAERVQLQARAQRLASEQSMLEQEQLSQAVRSDLLQAQRAVLERQITSSEAAVERLSNDLELLLSNMTERIRRAANSIPAEVIAQDDTVESLASEVRQLADDLEAAISQGKQLQGTQDKIRNSRENLEAEFSSLQEQLELNSNGGAIVQLLFNLDRRCQEAVKRLRGNPISGLEDSRIASLQVREKLRAQPALEQQLADPLPPSVQNLLTVRKETLEELSRRFAGLTRSLAAAEQERQAYLEQAEQVRDAIAQSLFGFGLRACPPVSIGTITQLPGATGWFLQPRHWQEAGQAILAALSRRTVISTLVILALVALLVSRPWIIQSLEASGRRNKRISTDRYRNTLEALVWTILLAMPLPLLFGYLAWVFGDLPEKSDWFAGIQSGIERSTWIVLTTAGMLTVMRRGGLAQLHFGWSEVRVSQIRRAIFLTTVGYVPALIITIGCTYGDAAAYLQNLGRVCFVLAHLWASYQVVRLFISADGILAQDPESEDFQGRTRWRWIWFGLLAGALLAITVMMLLGYMITALIWSLGLVVTMVIIGVGCVLCGLALRWFSMQQRKLALNEAIEKRRSQQAAMGDEEPSEIVEVDSEEGSEISLDMVGEQTRQLLRTVFSLAVLLTILAFWSQALPLADLAGSITLPLLGGVSLLSLSLAILLTSVIVIVVKNLPGFLDLTVFRSKKVQAGTRLAISTLCQYAAIAIGVIALANVLHVDWAQFGWIVTALSVGIGFGLQEVVANFVSGLILLLERPIRVGDIVTVESTTGTVKKIHLRATTITNWDRQEFVVPNRTLITNTLLNWTLSAPLNRVVIPVGIAYGSDTEKAREILLAVAADHPNVLADPGPMATFEQFADSSLNIILRAYLPDLDARLSTISELHTEINRQFAKAGIEIAFPQRDLHIRSGLKEVFASPSP